MQQNMLVTLENLLVGGRWGFYWFGLFALLLFSAANQPAFSQERFFTLNFLALVMLLISARGPGPAYRPGYYDSANRIMMHLLPILWLYLLVKNAALFSGEQTVVEEVRRTKTFSLVGLAALLGLFVMLWLARPVDYVPRAVVVADGTSAFQVEHGLQLALRGRSDNQFAEAQTSGPAVITLDFQRPVSARLLEIEQGWDNIYRDYSTYLRQGYAFIYGQWTYNYLVGGFISKEVDTHFEDFAWEISDDGENWFELFDGRDTNRGLAKVRWPNVLYFPLKPDQTFRYLRIHFTPQDPTVGLRIDRISVYAQNYDRLIFPMDAWTKLVRNTIQRLASSYSQATP